MLFSGLRSAEVLALQVRDMDIPRRWIRVVGKGDKERRVPLDVDVAGLLQTCLLAERPESPSITLFLVAKGSHRGQSHVRHRWCRQGGGHIRSPGPVFDHGRPSTQESFMTTRTATATQSFGADQHESDRSNAAVPQLSVPARPIDAPTRASRARIPLTNPKGLTGKALTWFSTRKYGQVLAAGLHAGRGDGGECPQRPVNYWC